MPSADGGDERPHSGPTLQEEDPTSGSRLEIVSRRRRALLDHAREVLFATELDGTILDANVAAGTALGIDLSVDHPETLLLCVGQPDAPAVRRVLETIARTATAEIDLHLRSPSGRVLWAVRARFGADVRAVLWSATTLADRSAAGLRRLVLDKTELLERERERAVMAEAASGAKDRLLAIVGEDSAATLNAALGWTRMLRREVLDATSRDMALAVIEGNVERHLALVSELVEIARVVEGELQLELGRVHIGGLVERAISTAAVLAAERGVVFCRAECCPIDGEATILGDAVRLEQLLRAAIESSVEGAMRGDEVSVDVRCVDGLFVIRVTGGRASQRAASFAHVLRAPGTGPLVDRGVDLDFLLVERIARLHGGSASASLDSHNRRVIEARLPRSGAASAPSSPGRKRPLQGLRVLVFEPDADVRALTATLIRESGATVLGARDEATAAAGIAAFSPDVVVTDVESVEQSGELGRVLSERKSSPAVVALTARAPLEAGRAVPSSAMISKPVDAQTLIEEIQRSRGE